jgi:multicomponent Na+:H+ antiporter subunit E
VIGRAAALGWLLVVWLGLWESASVANVVGGLLAGGVLLLAFPLRDDPGLNAARTPGPTFWLRPLPVLVFLGVYAWKLLEANLIVTWEVLTPGTRVNEGIVAVPVTGASPLVLALLANAVSLTPGTMVVEITRDPPVLYVHVLHLRSIEQVRLELFRLERLLVRAVGSEQTPQDVDARIAELAKPEAGRREGGHRRRHGARR